MCLSMPIRVALFYLEHDRGKREDLVYVQVPILPFSQEVANELHGSLIKEVGTENRRDENDHHSGKDSNFEGELSFQELSG